MSDPMSVEFVVWLMESPWDHPYKADGSYCGWSNYNWRTHCKGCNEDHPHAAEILAIARDAGLQVNEYGTVNLPADPHD